ncbi:hypothetical protein COY07_02705 [Candidatus Peregrinibacteria bacterium CG_4_10_14_0_2_um_filter_43_11]|nr:MAG: hypothetical protein COY07_02705 [Candidatus Peregrinibacteria bacterium CG_4_10_14_0_2_um_filter_43_11]
MALKKSPPISQTNINLRAHHLFTLLQLHYCGAHRSRVQELFFRVFKRSQFKKMGYPDSRGFADHMVDSMLLILKGQVAQATIVATRDAVCQACPQKRDGHCHVMGRDYSDAFLSMADEAVIRNSNGVLEVGKPYPPKYFIENRAIIVGALIVAGLEMRGAEK